jgi:hypothetical protein
MRHAARACCLLVIVGLCCSAEFSVAYDPFYDNTNDFSSSLHRLDDVVMSIPGLGTLGTSLQDVLQQGEGGDDMVCVAAAPHSTTARTVPEAAALIKGDSMLEPELPPATADIMAQLHQSLQQQEQAALVMQAAYPTGAAAVASLTDSWIGSTL